MKIKTIKEKTYVFKLLVYVLIISIVDAFVDIGYHYKDILAA